MPPEAEHLTVIALFTSTAEAESVEVFASAADTVSGKYTFSNVPLLSFAFIHIEYSPVKVGVKATSELLPNA